MPNINYTDCNVDNITKIEFGKETTTKAENGAEVKYKYGTLFYKYGELNVAAFNLVTPLFDMDYGISLEEKKKATQPQVPTYQTPMNGGMPMYSAAKATNNKSDYLTYKCPIKLQLEKKDHVEFYELTNKIVARCNTLLYTYKSQIYRGDAQPGDKFFKDPIARKAKNDDKSIKEDSAPTIWATIKGSKKSIQDIIVPVTGGRIEPSLLIGSSLSCKAVITIKIYAGDNGATTFKADVISLIIFNIKPSQARQEAHEIIQNTIGSDPEAIKNFEENLEKVKSLRQLSSEEEKDCGEKAQEKEQAQTTLNDLQPPQSSILNTGMQQPPNTLNMMPMTAGYGNQGQFMNNNYPPQTFNSGYPPQTTFNSMQTPNMYNFMK